VSVKALLHKNLQRFDPDSIVSNAALGSLRRKSQFRSVGTIEQRIFLERNCKERGLAEYPRDVPKYNGENTQSSIGIRQRSRAPSLW